MDQKPAKPSRTLRCGIFPVFAALFLLFALVAAYSLMMFQSVRERAEKENLAADQAQANLGVLFVADHQHSLLNRLAAVASRNSFKRALANRDMESLSAYLLPLSEQPQEIETVFLTGPKGELILALPRPARLPLEVPSGGQAKCPVVSAAMASPGGGTLVSLSAPIKSKDGALLGFLGVHQRSSLWERFFANLSARPGRLYYLFDQNGGLVAAGPDKERQNAHSGWTKLANEIRGKAQKRLGSMAKLVTMPGQDRRAFVSAAPVSGLGWVLVVVQDHALAMASTEALAQHIFFFLLLLFISLALVAFLLASRYRIQQEALIQTDELARSLENKVLERTAALKASTDRYRILLQDLPDMVYEVDDRGRMTLVSDAARDILGFEPHEMIGKPRREFVLPEDRHKFDEERARAERGQAMSILALRHRTKDGKVRWLSTHSRILTDNRGRPIGRRGVARDVSQQILAEERIHELSGKLISAQEEERKRLALDLHDELGQLLSALKIGLQSIAHDKPPGITAELKRLIHLSQTIMDRVRTLAYNLRPAILDNFGLAAAIQDLCDSLAETGVLQAECRLQEVRSGLSPEVKISLFRCVQEALNNVVKHSDSSWAEVELQRRDDRLVVEVRDYGRGFEPEFTLAAGQGGRQLGLLGMQERLSLIGGALYVESSSEKGTTIRAEVPLGGGV